MSFGRGKSPACSVTILEVRDCREATMRQHADPAWHASARCSAGREELRFFLFGLLGRVVLIRFPVELGGTLRVNASNSTPTILGSGKSTLGDSCKKMLRSNRLSANQTAVFPVLFCHRFFVPGVTETGEWEDYVHSRKHLRFRILLRIPLRSSEI